MFIRFVLYSAMEELGDCSFDMTHASNRFDFDSHNDNNFNNFAFWSALATENTRKKKKETGSSANQCPF